MVEVGIMKILIKNIDLITYYNDTLKEIENGFILIEDRYIKEIGSDYKKTSDKYDLQIDGKGKMAIPGLINTHTHAAMTLLRGYADDMPLDLWLQNKIWPYEAKLTADDIYWGTMLAITEMIKTGTTTFTDMYFKMDYVARAVEETGIRGVLTEGLIEANDGTDGLMNSIDYAVTYNSSAEGRISTMLAPHSIYTCSAEYLKKIKGAAIEHNLPINIHLAETKGEYNDCIKQNGFSPTVYLNSLDFFEVPVLAAHCVYLEEHDITILADNGVSVSYNPCSNMKLGSGIAPINNLLKNNVTVGIGTDGVASNNNLDIIEEARIGSYLQKVNLLDSTVLNTTDLLKMLTINGAKALRINNLGQLKEGYLADIILIDLTNDSYYYPHHNNLSNYFYAGNGRDVDTVIINGQLVMHGKELKTIDQERVFYEVKKIRKS